MATASSPSPPVARSTTWFQGTSAAVSTATTPGSARAAEVSMAAILADATSARTTLPWSMPGSCQSAAYSSDPSTLSTKSWCAGLCPTTRNAAWRAGASVSGMAAGPLRGLRGVFLDRVQDLAVAGAAAQVADQLPADPLAARPRVALEERPGGEQHAGRAEAALRRPVAQEARLQRVELAARGQAANGQQRVAVGLHREQQAAADRLAVEQDRAGPAHPLAAAVADLVVAEDVPEHVEEAVVREHPCLPLLVVDRECHGQPGGAAHGADPPSPRARAAASASARRPKTAARRRRYGPEAWTSSSGWSMAAARSATRWSSASSGAAPSRSASTSAGTGQGRSATPPNATEPAATVPSSSSSTTAATPTTIQSELRRLISRNDQPPRGPRVGTRTSATTSSGSSVVVRYDTSRSPAATSRAPAGPRAVTSAPSATATQGSSAAGSAWARLPPMVPRVRVRTLPTRAAASARIGQRRRTTSDSSMAWCRVSAGRRRYPPWSSIGPAPTGLMSTSHAGRANLRLSIGTRLWPAEWTLESTPRSCSSCAPASKDDTRSLPSGAATIALPPRPSGAASRSASTEAMAAWVLVTT